MKLTMCSFQGRDQLAAVTASGLFLPCRSADWPAELGDLLALIEAGPDALALLGTRVGSAAAEDMIAIEQARLLAPIPRPRRNVMCLGWNYADHIAETSAASGRQSKLPDHPVVFTKSASCVIGPDQPIPYDASVSVEIDWEVELAVIIGRPGRGIAAEQALEHVFGYTIVNDISARDIQMRHKQFFLGKSLDGSCPMGPWVVTADEIADPQALDLSCKVNGVLMQRSNTRHQIFDIATTIAVLSRGMLLEPGDVIATGTPSGVGFTRSPPKFLRPGDVVECEVQDIGRLANPVAAR